ncbi:MAG TPA: cytochrome P450 [Candidatus Binatia bacterium]|nr:cytochrome P450 [Candidatus Binatia bacterium]
MARPRFELPEFVADPFGTLERARATGWLADLDISPGVLTYAAVRELLTDRRLRASFPDFLHLVGVTSGPFYDWMAMSPLNQDGPEHQRWRALMFRAFTPRSVDRVRPFLRDLAGTLIDEFAPRGSCEFMAEFADPFPSLGLCELIGVPTADRDRFREWSNTIGLGFNLLEIPVRLAEIEAALLQLLAYTRELAARRRVEPRDDLVTRIAQAAREDGWTEDQAAGFIAGLVFAGHETTKNQLGWMVGILAGHDDIWDGVAAGTLAADDVVEEVLRHRSAVTGVGRRVAEPIERDGERLESGTQLFFSLWSADHDEAAFPRPAELDPVANAGTPHLAFGHGLHHCLGAALARADLQEALSALTARLEQPRVAEGAVWKVPAGINGPERLPITFARRQK